MRRRVEEAVSPWEHAHDEQALLHLEIAPDHKKQEEKQAEKREDGVINEEKAAIVHAVHPQPQGKPDERRQRKQSVEVLVKPKCNSNIQLYINRLEEKAGQDRPKPHLEQKRLEIAIKPIAKNDLTIHIPLDASNHNKIAIERPIKHMPKSSREAPAAQERHELKDQMRDFGIKYQSRKHSVDNLQRPSKHDAALRKGQEHEEQIIKKCALKNIQIY